MGTEEITIPGGAPFEIQEVYSDADCEVSLEAGTLTYRSDGNWKVAAVYLRSYDGRYEKREHKGQSLLKNNYG